MHHERLDDLWIKIFIGLGVFTGLLVVLVPIMILAYSARELDRFKACQAGTEEDCEPSLVWVLNDYVETAISTELEDESEAERESRTSNQAPRISKLEIGGAEKDGARYSVSAGNVDLEAWIDGQVERVDVLYIASDTATPGIGKKIGTLTKKDGVFKGTVKLEKEQAGELEVRAVFGQEYGLRAVRFAVN